MLNATEIKDIFSKIQSGTVMNIEEIHNLIQKSYRLTSEDWAVHTKTRPTNYSTWKHRVQSVLSEYKRKGKVKHDSKKHNYTFL